LPAPLPKKELEAETVPSDKNSRESAVAHCQPFNDLSNRSRSLSPVLVGVGATCEVSLYHVPTRLDEPGRRSNKAPIIAAAATSRIIASSPAVLLVVVLTLYFLEELTFWEIRGICGPCSGAISDARASLGVGVFRDTNVSCEGGVLGAMIGVGAIGSAF
jgi:hypothetical protein